MADAEKPDLENKVVKVEEELLRLNPQLFEDIPKNKKDEIVRSIISVSSYRSSPFPPAEELRKYEELYPGCTKIIFDNFQAQSSHRIKMEGIVITSQQKQSSTGQILAFTIAILFLGVAAWVTLSGHDVVGGIFGGIDIVGLVAVFLAGKKQQFSDLADKRTGNKLPQKKEHKQQ